MAALTVVTAGVLMKLGLYTGIPAYFSVLISFGLMTPVWLGIRLDRKARIKKMLGQFAEQGFIKCAADQLEPDLLGALESMEPHAFPVETIGFASQGIIQEREVVLLEVYTQKDHQTFTGCAAWIPFDLPKTLIRRGTLKDRLSKHEALGKPDFDKQRVFQSESPVQVFSAVRDLSSWFVTDRSQITSFRMGQPPGKSEQWCFSGHWIVLVDHGSAYAKHHLAMADFLVAFVEDFEKYFSDPSARSTGATPRVERLNSTDSRD